jgi:dihydroorotate dehydrogenase (NAD+) catalytic subunit
MTIANNLDLTVELAGGGKRSLVLRNPVMTASGTFSNGLEFAKVFDIQRLGAIVSKGLTLQPRRGNPMPRIAETPSGMLNSIGFQNIGLRRLVSDVAPVWATWDVPAVVNIMGDTVEEFATLARELDGVPGVSALEVNISCPNLDVGGMEFGQDPAMAADVTAAVVQASTLPVIVKLTPNVTDIVPIARAVEEAGAHALCVANSFLGTSIDVTTHRTRTHRPTAGLTGPAIRPLALRLVLETARAVAIPVIGCGGISNGRDALEFILAGASAVQVGTATFRDPRAPLHVLEELEAYCQAEGLATLRELVGAANLDT